MIQRLDYLAYRLPILYIGAGAVIVSILLVFFVQGCIQTARVEQPRMQARVAYTSYSPNAVSAALDEGLHTAGVYLGDAGTIAAGGARHAGAAVGHSSSAAASGAANVLGTIASGMRLAAVGIAKGVGLVTVAVAKGIGSALMAVTTGVARTLVFIARLPITTFGLISDTKVVASVIKPADHNPVPTIESHDPAVLAAQKALAIKPADAHAGEHKEDHKDEAVKPAAPEEAIWPIHGQITTHFGEGGRFYRTAHTGIDISDGKPSGVTPIKAFRSGKVIAAGREGGLGLRVIIEHDHGITSVYGHLSSIAVREGEVVTTATTLGMQGSTGVSTGPHLHFEVRVNGQAADPLLFIPGRP